MKKFTENYRIYNSVYTTQYYECNVCYRSKKYLNDNK